MSAAMTHSGDPDYWLGTLSGAIGEYLHGRQDDRHLMSTYRSFLRSPACTDGLRNVLPTPTRRPPAKVRGRRH